MSFKYAKNDNLIVAFLKRVNYEITEEGRIFRVNLKTGVRREIGYKYRGYWRIKLTKNGPALSVHRIVYAKFIGPLDEELVINHKDGNGLNNSIENLELDTVAHNNLHRYRELKRPGVAGHRKITPEIANEIRMWRANGMTYTEILALAGPKYGLTSKGTISEIINNKIWAGEVTLGSTVVETTYNQKKEK